MARNAYSDYNGAITKYHSPLYPIDEDIDSLEAVARDAELYEDDLTFKRGRKSKHYSLDDEDEDIYD